MPTGGATARAEQMAALSSVIHELATADTLGEMLDAAGDDGHEGRLLAVARRDYERARKLSTDLVVEMTRSEGISTGGLATGASHV